MLVTGPAFEPFAGLDGLSVSGQQCPSGGRAAEVVIQALGC